MPQVDLKTLSDLSTPWCIYVASTLRIADHLAAGRHELAELASACGAHAESLHRVLRHLVGKGIFEEPVPGSFFLNEPAREFLHPAFRLGLDLDRFGGRMALAWGSLLRAVRTGEPAYDSVFGRPFWDDLSAHPEIAESFDALMGPVGHGIPDPDLLGSGGWESVRTVLDVGGGTGALLAEILKAQPHVRGTLLDLPSTVARSSELFAAAGVSDRVTTRGQSFFDSLPKADLVLLKSVLSDWGDRDATAILARCADAAHPSGRVVLLNGVVPDAESGPPPALLMMVLVGGKDRTLSEFRRLAGAAGLEVHAAAPCGSWRFVVECRA